MSVPPVTPAGPVAGPRLLRRPREDRAVFGVASGLARYLEVDVVIVRIAFVALTVLGGSGVLLYVIGLIAIPEERPEEAAAVAAGTRTHGATPAVVIGAALIVLGVVNLSGQLVPGLHDMSGPVVLVAIGVLVLVLGGRR
jgi:phage shock protein C